MIKIKTTLRRYLNSKQAYLMGQCLDIRRNQNLGINDEHEAKELIECEAQLDIVNEIITICQQRNKF